MCVYNFKPSSLLLRLIRPPPCWLLAIQSARTSLKWQQKEASHTTSTRSPTRWVHLPYQPDHRLGGYTYLINQITTSVGTPTTSTRSQTMWVHIPHQQNHRLGGYTYHTNQITDPAGAPTTPTRSLTRGVYLPHHPDR